MSNLAIFLIGVAVFGITVFGAVMSASVTLTRRFYEQNDGYQKRPGFENAGVGRPRSVAEPHSSERSPGS